MPDPEIGKPKTYTFGRGTGDQFRAEMIHENAGGFSIGMRAISYYGIKAVNMVQKGSCKYEMGIFFPSPEMMRAAAESLKEMADQWERGELQFD